jgi:hypothetical protein
VRRSSNRRSCLSDSFEKIAWPLGCASSFCRIDPCLICDRCGSSEIQGSLHRATDDGTVWCVGRDDVGCWLVGRGNGRSRFLCFPRGDLEHGRERWPPGRYMPISFIYNSLRNLLPSKFVQTKGLRVNYSIQRRYRQILLNKKVTGKCL